jgi:pilus assembly protein TadC
MNWAFLLLASLAGFAGFYVLLIWWFYLATRRRLKRIRRRVPRNLWA